MNRQYSLLTFAYRQLLRLYPADFRREYGAALEQLVRDLDHETCGWQARLALWIRLALDTLWSALQLHLERLMKMKSWIMVVLAVASGFLIGYMDVRAGQIQATLMVIMVATLLLGFAEPKRAWLWALLALWFLAGGMWLSATNSPQPYMPKYLVLALILVVPAQVGAYIGVTTRTLLERHHAMRLS